MASFREAVEICCDVKFVFRRPKWNPKHHICVDMGELWWHDGRACSATVEDICADDYEVIRGADSVLSDPR